MTRRLLFLFALSALIVLSGCGGGGTSGFLFYHRFSCLVPDISGVDFAVAGVTTDLDVDYGDSTDFTNTNKTDPTEDFDGYEEATTNILDSININRVEDASTHIFALGMGSPGSLQPLVRLTNLTINRATPNGSNARIFVVHGFIRAAGIQTPSIDFVRSGQTPPVLTNIAFGGSGSFTLPAGTYDFTVRIAGLLESDLLTEIGVPIIGGKIYLLLLGGIEGAGGGLAPNIFVIEEPTLDI